MKKRVAIILAIIMTMSGVAAFAAEPTVTMIIPNVVGDVFGEQMWVTPLAYIEHNGSDYDWEVTFTDEGGATQLVVPGAAWAAWPEYSEGLCGTNVTDSTLVPWFFTNAAGGDYTVNDGAGVLHHLIVSVGNVVTSSVDFYVEWLKGQGYNLELITEAPDDEPWGHQRFDESETVTYSHNSVCSFGFHLRDVSDITDKWYMVSAVDISRDGKQVLPLVGGNKYIIGKVTIEKMGDALTLTTEYAPGVWVYGEYFDLFGEYADITTEAIENRDSDYVFGETLSIADDLGGDTQIYLFVCNEATFKSDNKALTMFFENIDEFRTLRQAMLDTIGVTETQVPLRHSVAP